MFCIRFSSQNKIIDTKLNSSSGPGHTLCQSASVLSVRPFPSRSSVRSVWCRRLGRRRRPTPTPGALDLTFAGDEHPLGTVTPFPFLLCKTELPNPSYLYSDLI